MTILAGDRKSVCAGSLRAGHDGRSELAEDDEPMTRAGEDAR
jgi:hypothetical protein